MTTITPGPLRDAAERTPTALWNDSSDLEELTQSIAMGAVGATCNPTIAYTTLKKHPDIWAPRIKQIAKDMPEASEAEIGWKAVADMSVEAAKLLEPAFEESKGRNGRLSVQTDPRHYRNWKALADQAVEFDKLAKNIIVKIPATSVGLKAIEDATYRGVTINVTVSFTVPQAVATAEAIQRGLDRREAEGLDTSKMWPVVTLMVGRLDDWLKIVAERQGLVFNPGILEWAGIAAFKRAAEEFAKRGFKSRMLAAAFRNTMHYTELVGGDVVISPPFKWQKRVNDAGTPMVERFDDPVPQEILDQLLEIDEFRRAYEPDGMTPEEFDTFGATVRTLRGFLADDANLDALVRDIILPQP
ncbi:MAG: transaldolase family protein [Actinomycetaceae bacterium]|nr:transaldolase family protein [Actinomycetaceae bacterium]